MLGSEGLISVFQLANISFESCSFIDNEGYQDGSIFHLMNCFLPMNLSVILKLKLT